MTIDYRDLIILKKCFFILEKLCKLKTMLFELYPRQPEDYRYRPFCHRETGEALDKLIYWLWSELGLMIIRINNSWEGWNKLDKKTQKFIHELTERIGDP